jgi:hypothetical protein
VRDVEAVTPAVLVCQAGMTECEPTPFERDRPFLPSAESSRLPGGVTVSVERHRGRIVVRVEEPGKER